MWNFLCRFHSFTSAWRFTEREVRFYTCCCFSAFAYGYISRLVFTVEQRSLLSVGFIKSISTVLHVLISDHMLCSLPVPNNQLGNLYIRNEHCFFLMAQLTALICSEAAVGWDSDSLFTKFYNKEGVSKSGKHTKISKWQHRHPSTRAEQVSSEVSALSLQSLWHHPLPPCPPPPTTTTTTSPFPRNKYPQM